MKRDWKSPFSSKVKILVKSYNLGQKLQFWSKVKNLVISKNFGQNQNFGQK